MRGSIAAAALLLAILLGVLAGAGGTTVHTAEGAAYLSDDPKVCVNCHIMREQYEGWQHASHHAVTVCNDCHLSHDSLLEKLWVKAQNGWHHSRAFTMQDFEEPIRIKPSNAQVLERNCIRCHGALVHEITAHEPIGDPLDTTSTELYGCVRCHQDVGHGASR